MRRRRKAAAVRPRVVDVGGGTTRIGRRNRPLRRSIFIPVSFAAAAVASTAATVASAAAAAAVTVTIMRESGDDVVSWRPTCASFYAVVC